MLRVITGGVGKGKSTKVFEEIRDALTNSNNGILLITGEYTAMYDANKIGYNPNTDGKLTICQNVRPRDMNDLANWILVRKPSYKVVYVDGFMPSKRELKLIELMAEYSDLEVVMTMQLNRVYGDEEVKEYLVRDGELI